MIKKSRFLHGAIALAAYGSTACVTLADADRTDASKIRFSSTELQGHVEVLASDAFEGRGAGYAGEKKAAAYIAEQFSEIGLKPFASSKEGLRGFLQPFEMQVLGGVEPWQVLDSQNVVGVLPGTDPDAGYVVIGGHYDGQGKAGQALLGRDVPEGDHDYVAPTGDDIWNSAVDNAVSIATVIEIADFMASLPDRPKRSIVFAAFGAEESALDGSTYFVNNLTGKFGGIRAMINLEKLVGHEKSEFLYVSYGTSAVFPIITEIAVLSTGVSLTPFYPGVIANSDHYAFILSAIPAITMGTGASQFVHTPSDHADSPDYGLLADRTEFVAAYLFELANFDSSFAFSGDVAGRYGASGGSATREEALLRGAGSDVAFKVATVVNGSPAAQAGLRPGDLITAIDGEPVREQSFYQGVEDLLPHDACASHQVTVHRERQAVAIISLPSPC